MKEVKKKLQETKPDEVAAFEKGAQAFAKKIVGSFKDFEFVRIKSRFLRELNSDPPRFVVHRRVYEP